MEASEGLTRIRGNEEKPTKLDIEGSDGWGELRSPEVNRFLLEWILVMAISFGEFCQNIQTINTAI